MISTDDWHEINDVLARYCWAVDEGDGEGYAGLWTADGVLSGVGPARVGSEALAQVAIGTRQRSNRLMRHLYSNLVCDYAGTGRDEIHGKYYNYVSVYDAPARPFAMFLCQAVFVRQDGRWRIKTNDLEMIPPPPAG